MRWCSPAAGEQKGRGSLVLERVTKSTSTHWICELLVLYSGWRVLVSPSCIPLSIHITLSMSTGHTHRYLPIQTPHMHHAHIAHVYISRHQHAQVLRLGNTQIPLLTALRDLQVFVVTLLPLTSTFRGSQHTKMSQPRITLMSRAYANKSD